MSFLINESVFTLKDLEKHFNKKADKDKLKKINKIKEIESRNKKSREINKLFKEVLGVRHVGSFSDDLKFASILFGNPGKCNAVMYSNKDDSTFRFCKGYPSKNKEGDINGRCNKHGGKVKGNKQRGRGVSKGTNKGKKHALKNGSGVREDVELNKRIKRLKKVKEEAIKISSVLDDHEDEIENILQDLKRRKIEQEELIQKIRKDMQKPLEFVPVYNKFGEPLVDDKTGKEVVKEKLRASPQDLQIAIDVYEKIIRRIESVLQTKFEFDKDSPDTLDKGISIDFNLPKEFWETRESEGEVNEKEHKE